MKSPASLQVSDVWLRSAEWLMVIIIAVLGVATTILTEVLGKDVHWSAFLPGIAAVLLLVLLGAYIRKTRGYLRLASCAVGIGLYVGFSAFVSIFIFALYPLSYPLIDMQLISADALLGYNWKAFVEGLASLPGVPEGLRILYLTSFPQLAFVIIFLGIIGHEVAQHRFLLVGMLTLSAAIPFFYFFPSVGPPPFDPVSPDLQQRFGLAADPRYGAYLLELIRVGPPYIAPELMTGVIGFPSFHIVMSLMVFWYTRTTVLLVPAVISGIVMIPATLAHGGHHLMDLFGGLALFAVCAWITARLVPDQSHPTR